MLSRRKVRSSGALCFIAFLYVFVRFCYVEEIKSASTYIENVNLPCQQIFNGDLKIIRKAKHWTYHFDQIEREIYKADDVCDTINKYFFFESKPLSQEEADFPLAYGIVVYKNIVQVLLELSIYYQPQNAYVFTVDQSSPKEFKDVVLALPRCLKNVASFVGAHSAWGSFGILKNVFSSFKFLVKMDHKWKYYQYLSGSDVPLRTNHETVRILKIMNGSINSDIDEYESDRYKNMEGLRSPLPLYKSSMSVVVPREAGEYIINSNRVRELLRYLSSTWVPDESFWSTIAGSPGLLPVPGAFRARDIIWLRKHFWRPGDLEQTVSTVGTSYIGRYQVWSWQKPCKGTIKSYSCVFGVGDLPIVVTRPELLAHKFYLEFEPAGMMCLVKELRRRSYEETDFDASSYGQMPTVELASGRQITELSHPEWLLRSSFYHPAF